MAKTSMDPRLLETESIPKLLWQYALPAVITTLSTSVYNLIDRIFIGHGAGAMAISGLALSLPIMTFLQAFGTLVGVGASTRISIVLGMKDREWAERILGNALFLTVIMWALLTVLCLAFLEPLLKIFGGSENTIPYAADYLRIIIPGNIFANLSYSFCNIIRASGSPIRSMTIMISGMVLNAILAPIFIFWFDWGIQGAAIATVISQACSALWVVGFLCSKKASLRLERKYLKADRRVILSVLALGVSPFIMASTESMVGFVLNGSLQRFGDIYVSALAILQSAMQFASVPLTGFAQGFVPIASYNYGHGDTARVRQCFRVAVTVMFSFNLVLMLLMILFPTVVASAFTTDPKLLETVRQTMPVFLAGMTIFGLQRACQNMFVALGQARISVFIALLRKVFLLIPLALLLPHGMGVMGVFASEGISDATAAICCTLLFAWQFPKILKKVA